MQRPPIPWALLVFILIFPNFSPIVVGENHTVFRDDFDNIRNFSCWGQEYRCVSKSDSNEVARAYGGVGFGYIRLSQVRGDGWKYISLLNVEGSRHVHENIEIRLNCSNDNKNNNSKGGGLMLWGWVKLGVGIDNALCFFSASPESTDSYGFWALSIVNGNLTLMEPITGIDIVDWHTYTIVWEPGCAEFLVDQKVVASTNLPPQDPMSLYISIDNRVLEGLPNSQGWYYLDIPYSEIRFDYIHIFIDEHIFLEIPGLFEQARQTIWDAEKQGMDIRDMKTDYYRAEDAWEKGDIGRTDLYLKRIIEKRKDIPEEPTIWLAILYSSIMPSILYKKRQN